MPGDRVGGRAWGGVEEGEAGGAGWSGPHRALPAPERNLCPSSESRWELGVPGGMGRIPAMWATPRKDQRDHRERGIPGALELSQR